MEKAEAYRDTRELTPELLLELTQSLKYHQTNMHTGLHSDLRVTEKNIEDMAEATKSLLFFVSPAIMRAAMELAQSKGKLMGRRKWLKVTHA